MPFWTYSQNNSGGTFQRPALYVVVEANDVEEANYRAEELGLYWDGVLAERDCECCGDRWYPQSGAGDTAPPDKIQLDLNKHTLIYYLDGREKTYGTFSV